MDKNKLVLSITILLASIVLGGFYYIIETNKLQSIEKQQMIKIKIDEERQINLNECLVTAQENYELAWNSTCSNGIGDWINICQGEQGKNCTQCILSDEEADGLNLLLEKDKEDCYKRFLIK